MGNHAGLGAQCGHCGTGACPDGARGGRDGELFDDGGSCDPAGTVFRETLEDLSEVDRLLLVFASSSNLAAVRWLFVLGASASTCDVNGTTALHCACRSGSMQVVEELVGRGLSLTAADTAGWTPLHVAFFMGRRGAALHLLRHGADLARRNGRGLVPADLSSDPWLRRAAGSCEQQQRLQGGAATWALRSEKVLEGDVQVSSRLRFEPFFVPRDPLLRNIADIPRLCQMGVDIFNRQPGHGLAFLVCTGCVRDFPLELSTFLAERRAGPAQIGEFLGEDFSLSQPLRLEFINAVRLEHTGVVSCLRKVFQEIGIPSNLQKIDRLLESAAQIWWRQHERLGDRPGSQAVVEPDGEEVAGTQLMRQLRDHTDLHQLLFSAVLLHWSLHADLPPAQRIGPEQWLSMNSSLSAEFDKPNPAQAIALKRIHIMIYSAVSRARVPQLDFWSRRSDAPPPAPSWASAPDGALADAEGWAKVAGARLAPPAAEAGPPHSRAAWQHGEGGLRPCRAPRVEGDGAVAVALPHASALCLPGGPSGPCEAPARDCGVSQVWLTLRHRVLLLASVQQAAPYAFVHLAGLQVEEASRTTCTITLSSTLCLCGQTVDPDGSGARLSQGAPNMWHELTEGGSAAPRLVFLLPDGRWKDRELPRLQFELEGPEQLARWSRALEAAGLAITTATAPPREVVSGPPGAGREPRGPA